MMKNIINKTIICLLSCFVLGGCNSTPPSSSTSIVEQTYDENGNPNAYSHTFSTLCENAYGVVIPFVSCVDYEYEHEIDPYGDPSSAVYFYYLSDETLDKAYNYYAYLCAEEGWEVNNGLIEGYDCIYANKIRIKGNNDAVELCFLPSLKNDKPCLGVFVTSYLYEDENVYPSVAINKLLGKDSVLIPKIEGEGYVYDFSFSYLEIEQGLYLNLRLIISNCTVSVEEQYFNALLKNKFLIISDSDDSDDPTILNSYPPYSGDAFDGYYYNAGGFLVVGTYFTYVSLYNAMLIDIFVIR